ncbi:MAG: YbaB/EbfC family nucleoid-associated protein [Alphaproteobacteria bacterium]|nr:YbaB/EbfC family nucleoid-associated protein [Alphaproteobacteria bacterium]
MKNLGQLMKQAQEMQSKVAEMQDRLADAEVTGSAGAGMVHVTLNGKGEVRQIKIDPGLTTGEDIEVLEDLLVAAFNDARAKVEQLASEEMKKITGGLALPPGMNFPL